MGGATLMASRTKAHKAKASRQRHIVYAQKDLTESGLAQLVASVQELLRHVRPVSCESLPTESYWHCVQCRNVQQYVADIANIIYSSSLASLTDLIFIVWDNWEITDNISWSCQRANVPAWSYEVNVVLPHPCSFLRQIPFALKRTPKNVCRMCSQGRGKAIVWARWKHLQLHCGPTCSWMVHCAGWPAWRHPSCSLRAWPCNLRMLRMSSTTRTSSTRWFAMIPHVWTIAL